MFEGRPLQVVRSDGKDKAAPVIVEELVGGVTRDCNGRPERIFPGQYALWSLDGVMRAAKP